MQRWKPPKVTFAFLACPLCRQDIDHPLLEESLRPWRGLRQDIRERSMIFFNKDDLGKEDDIKKQIADDYNGSALEWSMVNIDFFNCYTCKKPYYAGRHDCAQDEEENKEEGAEGKVAHDPDGKDLLCAPCSVTNIPTCATHGTDFIQFKCRFCCKLSVWHCWGKVHFCDTCHNLNNLLTSYPNGVSKLAMPGKGAKGVRRRIIIIFSIAKYVLGVH